MDHRNRDEPRLGQQERIRKLHLLYTGLTGLKVVLNYWRERDWYEWLRWAGPGAGFNEEALRLVVRHVRRTSGSDAEARERLRFSELISRPDVFEELLAEAQLERARRAAYRRRVRRREPVKLVEVLRRLKLTPEQLGVG